MAQLHLSNIHLNPNAESFVPKQYYLVVPPQYDHGHITPAYYYPVPSTYSLMQQPQQVVYQNPQQPFYQQLCHYQPGIAPQYFPSPPPPPPPMPQVMNHFYPCNSSCDANYMYSNRDVCENRNRGRNHNMRGDSKNFRGDYHYQRQYKHPRNYSYDNGNYSNNNGNRNYHNKYSHQNYNVQYVDHYNESNPNDEYYHHQEPENNEMTENRNDLQPRPFDDLDIDEIEASVFD